MSTLKLTLMLLKPFATMAKNQRGMIMTTYKTKALILCMLTLWLGISSVLPEYAIAFNESQTLLTSDRSNIYGSFWNTGSGHRATANGDINSDNMEERVNAGLINLSIAGFINKPAGQDKGRGIAFLGSRMFFSGSQGDSVIYELNPVTGAIINSFNPRLGFIIGLAANPADGLLYVEGCCENVIKKVIPNSGTVVGELTVEPTNMQGLAIYDNKLYVASNGDFAIYEIDIDTGATLRKTDVSNITTGWGNIDAGNIQGIEVFANTIFLNVDDAGTMLEIHEFSLTDLSHIGVGYTGSRAAGSGYDGEYLWIDIEGQESNGLIKLVPGPTSADPLLLSLGDINGDGSEDIAALMHDAAAGTVTAIIKDAENGSLLQQTTFSGSVKPVDFKIMADINTNDAPELVVLGKGQGSVKAEVRDSLTGALLGSVDFDFLEPIELEIMPDQNSNDIPELAVLSNDPVQVEVRDALSGVLLNTVIYNDNMTPKDLLILPDLNGEGGPEIGVLGEHDDSDKNDRVEIRDLLTGRWVRNLPYGKLNIEQAQVVPDLNNNGTPEIAVLRTSGDKVNVQVKDVVSKALVRHIGYDSKYASEELLVVPDVNGNGVPEVAVFGKNPINQSQKAQIKDANTKKIVRNVFFNKTFDPVDLVVMPDINGNGTSEIALLGIRPDNGLIRLIIKDSKSGILVSKVDY